MHGHLSHFDETMKNPFSNLTMKSLNLKRMERKKEILQNHHIDYFIEIWECEMETLIKTEEFKRFALTHQLCTHSPIQPRNALQGGRCNAFRLHYKAAENKRIRYYDIVSLYPYCCICKPYYVGTPEIVKHSFPENCLSTWNGLVKCEYVQALFCYSAFFCITDSATKMCIFFIF